MHATTPGMFWNCVCESQTLPPLHQTQAGGFYGKKTHVVLVWDSYRPRLSTTWSSPIEDVFDQHIISPDFSSTWQIHLKNQLIQVEIPGTKLFTQKLHQIKTPGICHMSHRNFVAAMVMHSQGGCSPWHLRIPCDQHVAITARWWLVILICFVNPMNDWLYDGTIHDTCM